MTNKEYEEKLLNVLVAALQEEEEREYLIVVRKHGGTRKKDINAAYAVRTSQYIILDVAQDSDYDNVGQAYVEQVYPNLELRVLAQIDFETLGIELEEDGGAFTEIGFIVDFLEPPDTVYDGVNAKELFVLLCQKGEDEEK